MKYIEYGAQNPEIIILLHGGGLSWWNFRAEAELLQERFHVILPILDGHAGSDRDFTTIADNAVEILAFLAEQFGGSVKAIGGLSLGAQILLEMLSQKPDCCQYAVIESALIVPSPLLHALIPASFGSCYGLVAQRWFAKLQAASLRIPKALFEAYYRDTCGITKANMIAFLQDNSVYTLKDSVRNCTARVSILVGAGENRAMRTSADQLHQVLPDSELHILPKLRHGEFSLNNPQQYVLMLTKLFTA